MNWLKKRAMSDMLRVKTNIARLENVKDRIRELGNFVIATQSGGFQVLTEILQESIVLGRPKLLEKLTSALIGENNQKVALDAPHTFKRLMIDAEAIIDVEIGKEKRKLREILSDEQS